MESFSLTCSSKKVWRFYNDHPNLDFESMNDIFIDIMNNLFQDMNSSLSTNLATQLLNNIQGLQNQMSTMTEHVNKLQGETISTIGGKLSDFKREYLEDVKLILSSNNADRIAPMIKECNAILLDKTHIMINDIIPKNNEALNKQIQESVKSYHDAIAEDTDKFLKNTISKKSLEEFFSTMETRLSGSISQSQQIVNSIITSSEQRLDTRITEIKTSTEKNIADIKDMSSSSQVANTSLQNNVGELLKKMEISSVKGKCSENILFNILESLYPSSQISIVGDQKETGDIILTRKNKPTILIENKNWGRNVIQEEVKKFIRDIEIQKCCGLFLSQNNGIANKENFEINIHEGNVLLYVHEVNNNAEKIKIAIDVIDNFKVKLDEIVLSNGDEFSIDKETLDDINKEFQNFALQKNSQIKNIKDFSQKLIKQIEDSQFPALENYLSTKYAFSSSKYVCEFCQYIAKNQSAMSAHKRGCKQKSISDGTDLNSITSTELEIVLPVDTLTPPKNTKKTKK